MGLSSEAVSVAALGVCPLIAALYMFVWPVVYRLFWNPEHEPIIPKFTNHLVTTNFWQTFPSVAVAIPFLFRLRFRDSLFSGAKRLLHLRLSVRWFLRSCRQILAGKNPRHACVQSVRALHRHVHFERVGARGSEAIRDGGRSGLHEVHGLRQRMSKRRALFRFWEADAPGSEIKCRSRDSYSLTWPEEIVGALVFLGSFLAVRGVYALVPFLMALGCAAVTTFLTLKTWRLLRARELSFYRFNLKSSGKMHKAGWAFAAFACAWIGLNAHCGWVRYHEFLGNLAFQQDSVARRTGPGAARSSPLAQPGGSGKHRRRKRALSGGFEDWGCL